MSGPGLKETSMNNLRLLAALVAVALFGAACGAAFATSGEQVAQPIGAETDDSGDDDATSDGGGADTSGADTSGADTSGADETATVDTADDSTNEDDDTEPIEEPEPTPEPETTASLGVVANEVGAFEGHVLFGPAQGASQYLVANDGEVTQTWTRFGPGQPDGDAELLPNGLLLRSAPAAAIEAIGASGRVELVADNGTVVWSCTLNESWFGGQHFQGDVAWIAPDPDRGTEPWGSLLLSAYIVQSGDRLGAIGKNLTGSDRVFVDSLIELVPAVIDDDLADSGGGYRRGDCGTTIWEWRATDRIEFDAADLPVPGGVDWTYFSSIAYSPEFDMVAAAAPGIGEVWVIDHATDTDASASDGVNAELLARVNDLGMASSVGWTIAGNLLVVADGVVYSVNPATSESEELFELDGQSGFAEQLPNGNLLITDSEAGRIVELDGAGVVWEFISPVVNDGSGNEPDSVLGLDAEAPSSGENRIGRAYKYPTDYSGLN